MAPTDRQLTPEQELAVMQSALDPVYFMRNFVKIRSQPDDVDDESNAPSQIVKLDLWPAQENLIEALQLHHWIISVKSRKIGFTTTGIGFGCWIQTFFPASRVHYFSRRDDAAIDMIQRHEFSMRNLPKWMQLPRVRKNDHTYVVMGPDGVERVAQAYPATPDTAIEQTADYTLLDEYASIREPMANVMWSGVEPTVAPTGYCLMISRGKGPQGTFANLLRTAMANGRLLGDDNGKLAAA